MTIYQMHFSILPSVKCLQYFACRLKLSGYIYPKFKINSAYNIYFVIGGHTLKRLIIFRIYTSRLIFYLAVSP